MLRNKELIGPFVITLALAAAAGLVCGALGGVAAGLAGAVCTARAGAVWLAVTVRRYARLRQLGEYLASVYAGGELLDIRDNREGELSLLKNDLHKITVTLRQQSEQLAHDKQFLQGLLGSISHQLRTPLTGMLVMADLLARPDLPDEKRAEFTGQLTAQLERMQWLLTLSRLDAGCLVMESAPVSLPALVRRAAVPVRVALELRGQTLELDCPEGPAWQGDEKWTAEAVTNLIKNASEHAPEGGRVTVRLRQDALAARITVEDNGPGIPAADRPRLFERFYRGSNAAPGSAGIGLALARELARAQGGEVTAANRADGPGACFTLRLPMRPGAL